MRRRKFLVILLALVMCTTFGMSNMAFAANVTLESKAYTFEKLSNPTKTNPKDADGLVDGGNRLNSYAWSMAELKDEYGDYLYIGSNNSLIGGTAMSMVSALGLSGSDVDLYKKLIKAATNDEIPTITQESCEMFRYNIDTESMEKIHSIKNGTGYRAAETFKGSVYMNAMAPEGAQILRIKDNNSNPEVVLGGTDFGANLRALKTSIDGKSMYVGGTMLGDEKYDFKPIVLRTTDGTNYETIADYTEPVFAKYIQKNAGYLANSGDLWDISEYNGHLYVTTWTQKGSIVFEGTESKSKWTWKELAGDNTKYTTKKHYKAGFGNRLNKAMTPYIFKNKLYFVTFSEAVDAMMNSFMTLAMALNGGDVNAFLESLKTMEDTLKNQSSIFRLNSNGNVEMVMGDKSKCPNNIKYSAKIGSGFNNKKAGTTTYVWRAAVYNGKLYVGTFDSSTLYRQVTNITKNDFLSSDIVKEFMEKLGVGGEDITKFISSLNGTGMDRFLNIAEIVSSNKNPGFEFYSTEDGVNYDTLSLNGFNDEYNYGVRTLVPTDTGLYLGTANPFYGAQLWRIQEKDIKKVTLKAKKSGSKKIALSWNPVNNAKKYVVYGNQKGKSLKKIATLTCHNYTLSKVLGKKLSKNKTYKFYVKAYKQDGTVKSNTAKLTLK